MSSNLNLRRPPGGACLSAGTWSTCENSMDFSSTEFIPQELDGLSLESLDGMSLSSMGDEDGRAAKGSGSDSGQSRSAEGYGPLEQLLRDRCALPRMCPLPPSARGLTPHAFRCAVAHWQCCLLQVKAAWRVVQAACELPAGQLTNSNWISARGFSNFFGKAQLKIVAPTVPLMPPPLSPPRVARRYRCADCSLQPATVWLRRR